MHRKAGSDPRPRADTVGLFLLAAGPWLAWLPMNFLGRLAAPKFRPLPLKFGRNRYRAGFITRRSAEDLTPFRLLEEIVRETALERSSRSPDRNVRRSAPIRRVYASFARTVVAGRRPPDKPSLNQRTCISQRTERIHQAHLVHGSAARMQKPRGSENQAQALASTHGDIETLTG